MRRALLLLTLPLLMAAGVDDPHQVTLTIYNADLALVQDIRQVDVPAGRTRLEFKDVSNLIRPQTVALSGNGLTVAEQNFDYDLLTPSKMMEKAVGKTIKIVRTNPATGNETTETATVLSVNQGVVLKIGNRIEVLRDDGIPTRVIFDGIPENLRARPTLSVTVDSQTAGPRAATLSYLTSGLSWNADYVATFDEKQGVIGMQGWITLSNRSGITFNDVSTRLVAGTVGLTNSNYNGSYRGAPVANTRGGTGSNDEPGGDFPIYTLPEHVTVAENQTKQVSFLDLSLKAEKTYAYHAYGYSSQQSPDHAAVELSFSNTQRALPTGTVRVYMRDTDGTPKFVGEQIINQTPANSELTVKLGEAFDVTIQSTVIKSEKLDDYRSRNSMSYEIRNAQGVPVTLDLRQEAWGRTGTISNESLPGRRINASTYGWRVTIPAHGQTVLTFTATSG